MIIEVMRREVFGNILFYPLNNNAQALIELMNKKTLNKYHLEICEKAGWVVEKSYPK